MFEFCGLLGVLRFVPGGFFGASAAGGLDFMLKICFLAFGRERWSVLERFPQTAPLDNLMRNLRVFPVKKSTRSNVRCGVSPTNPPMLKSERVEREFREIKS